MTRRRAAPALVCLALALAGCGVGDEPEPVPLTEAPIPPAAVPSVTQRMDLTPGPTPPTTGG